MFDRHFFKSERHSRLFEKGDLKYVILDLLKDKPNHGYEIMRALEERFHGFYTPSAGSVYPTLQMLEDMGYIAAEESDGKKVYAVTDEGKQFLKEQGEVVNRIKGHMKSWLNPRDRDEFRETMHELRSTGRLIGRRIHHLDPDKWARIRETISHACRDIEDILEK
ncbi:MAG: PadR family transcriptional regulator [Chloroflexi bacterium]|nr:PadR family transcriptional regulator [Chloroflexota bacterium]